MFSSDVIVIGGGLVGTAVAYGLAQPGKNIMVLDEGDDAFRASRGNFGLIWVHGKGLGNPQYVRWTRESARQWPALTTRLQGATGIDVQARQTGAFFQCFSEPELEARRERLAVLRDEVGGDHPYEILERAALLQRLPHVGPTVVGASFSPMDGHVNPLKLLRALHTACTQRGVTLKTGHEVQRITHADALFTAHSGGRQFPITSHPRRMEQPSGRLDAIYGDKEARTFATNHGLQILYAPREQRDADEYSAMLGHFTERATSRGRTRSLSANGHASVSRNESDQRRALLLPQEFKELGTERLVVIFENCKPILAEKIRYHRDPVFMERLLPPPVVAVMNMDLHFARVQRRWRYADDKLGEGESLDIEQLAQDFSSVPMPSDACTNSDIRLTVDSFFAKTLVGKSVEPAGGLIEPLHDEQVDARHGVQTPERRPIDMPAII